MFARSHPLAVPLLVAGLAATPALQNAGQISYEHDVRPILKAQCFHCHGEEPKLKGGLDLRLVKLIERGGDSGSVVVPGKRSESLLYQLISAGEMPPQKDKQLSPTEIAVIGDWIDAGMKTAMAEPEELPTPGEFFISPAERQHWSFQPLRRTKVPQNEYRHPLDAFLAEKLTAHGLEFSGEADRVTLIRRASFSLTGLPPSPGDVTSFLADEKPGAWERLVDRLLDSPHYGERWGRHWLDVAGYADSEGYNDQDTIRPDAWHYRDYVIRSLNEDKPWNQFIIEQLAGDELVGATHANANGLANADPDACEKLTATGFLRLAPDGSGSRPDDPEHAKQVVVTETVNIVSSALLGLTVGCAECHDHRFDPVSHQDFFRMRAIFAPVYDTENWRTPNSRRIALIGDEEKAKADALEAEAKIVEEQYIEEMMRVVGVIFERELEAIPASEREFARTAYETPAGDRTAEQETFLKDKYPAVNVQRSRLHLFLSKYEDGDELKKAYEELDKQVKEIRAQKPLPETVRVATEDTKQVPETRLLHRGDHNSPVGDPIAPADLEVLSSTTFPENDPDLPTTGRRLAFAKHLTTGEHPLVARVLVNRFWMHHFGRGLVPTPGEFGIRSEGPSHPELLDWLATEFVAKGWSLKEFHRLVLTSHAWRQDSRRHDAGEAIDADNALVWRMPVSRLEAETVRDAILSVSGRLQRDFFGEPIPVTENEGGLFAVGGGNLSDDRRELRRSVYVQQRRHAPVAMLEAFDAPQMEPNCEQRNSSTVAVQALELMNGDFALAEAEAFAQRVLYECGEDSPRKERASRAWELAYGVPPSPEELADLEQFLAVQEEALAPLKSDGGKDKDPVRPEDVALASLCQVLFKTNRFLYVD